MLINYIVFGRKGTKNIRNVQEYFVFCTIFYDFWSKVVQKKASRGRLNKELIFEGMPFFLRD